MAGTPARAVAAPSMAWSSPVWASRSRASWPSRSPSTAPRSSGLSARRAGAGAASSASTREPVASSRSAAGRERADEPDAVRLGSRDPAPRRADLEGARVADEVDERPGAAEVGHEPEARLAHREPRVERRDPQVGGQRQLEAGADGVAVHLRHDDGRALAPRREALLVGRDAPLDGLRTSRGELGHALLARHALGREHGRVDAGGEGVTGAAEDDDAYVLGNRRAPRRRAPPTATVSARCASPAGRA